MAKSRKHRYSFLVRQLREKIISEAKKSKYVEDWFLPHHLKVVEKYANWLCDLKPDADRDVVALGVWFHDLGRLRGHDEDHDIFGAKKVHHELNQAGYPNSKAKLAYEFVALIDVEMFSQRA